MMLKSMTAIFTMKGTGSQPRCRRKLMGCTGCRQFLNLSAVNFINVKHANFTYVSAFGQFFLLTCICQKDIRTKTPAQNVDEIDNWYLQVSCTKRCHQIVKNEDRCRESKKVEKHLFFWCLRT